MRRDHRRRHRRRRHRAVRGDPRAHARRCASGCSPTTERDLGARLAGRAVRRQGGAGQGARRAGRAALARRHGAVAAPTAARTCRCAAPCGPRRRARRARPCTCPCPTTPASRRRSSSPRAEDAVIEAYAVEQTSAPPRPPRWRELPEGDADAARRARARRRRRGPRCRERDGAAVVAAGRRRATTAATRCTPSRALAEAGVGSPRCVAVSEHPHAAGWRRVTAAGVEVVASLGARRTPRAVELVAGGGRRARRHPRHRRPARAAAARPRPWCDAVAGRRRWSSRSTCRAAPTPAGEVAAPSTVSPTRRSPSGSPSRCTCCRRRSRRSGVLTVVDIGVDARPGRPPSSGSTHDDVAALWPVPGTGRRQVLPRRARRRRRRRGLHRRRRALRHRRRRGRRRDGPLRRPADARPRWSAPPCPRPCTGPGGCRPGWSGPGLDPGDDTAHGRAQRDAALDALASATAVRRGRRRPRAARARARDPRRPCSRRTPASWPGC